MGEIKRRDSCVRGAMATKTPCKCPKCGKLYKKRVYYTGRLPMRCYCEKCWVNISEAVADDRDIVYQLPRVCYKHKPPKGV